MMLIFGSLVVVLRNPVSSAMSLVVSFIALAALFISLDAFFIGVLQILVYAGAVMVLFLFIIMLLDIKAEKQRKLNFPAFAGGALVVGGFVMVLTKVIGGFTDGDAPMPALKVAELDDVHEIGMLLFSNYTLPFQVIGTLILVATIGVVILSKRELK